MEQQKKVTVTVGDDDIKFAVDLQDYNTFVNGMSGEDKVAPSHNFCMNSVVSEDEAKLKEHLKGWGAALKIAGAIVQEVTGTVEISAKKQKPAKVN